MVINDNEDKLKQQLRQLVSTTCARINFLGRSKGYLLKTIKTTL